MKKYILTLLSLFVCFVSNAQDRQLLVNNLDNDSVSDTVRIDRERGVIVCRLYSRGFDTIESKAMEGIGKYTYGSLDLASYEPGEFSLAILGNRASTHYFFEYDKRKRGFVLTTYRFEALGGHYGDGYQYFEYSPLKGKAVRVEMNYTGSLYAEDFEPTSENTVWYRSRIKRPRLRIMLDEFSIEEFDSIIDKLYESNNWKTIQ